MADLGSLISTGTAAIDAVKKAIGLARNANLADLEKVLLDLRDDIATLRDANLDLRNENRELRERLARRETLEFAENVYWRPAADGTRDGPFCPKCYGTHDKANRLGFHEGSLPGYTTTRRYNCAVCGFSASAKG